MTAELQAVQRREQALSQDAASRAQEIESLQQQVYGRGYWLPVDAEPTSTANWISNLQITDILEAMSAKHVMVIADSCYSGTMTRLPETGIIFVS